MPKGPKGEKRPADVIGNAVKVMRIAVGEEKEEEAPPLSNRKIAASKGGIARASKLGQKRRSEIASKAAKAKADRAVLFEEEDS